MGAAKQVIRGTVNGAAEVGADIGQIARWVVDGILEAAKETGPNVGDVAKVTLNGAVEAAGSIGNTAVKAVRDVLVSVVGGVSGNCLHGSPKRQSESVDNGTRLSARRLGARSCLGRSPAH